MSRGLRLADHEIAMILAFRRLPAATRAWQRSSDDNDGDEIALQVYPDGSTQILVVEVKRMHGRTLAFPVLDSNQDLVDPMTILDEIANVSEKRRKHHARERSSGEMFDDTGSDTDEGDECEE